MLKKDEKLEYVNRDEFSPGTAARHGNVVVVQKESMLINLGHKKCVKKGIK